MEQLVLNDYFLRLWAGKNAFDEVRTLSGQEFRNIKNRRTFRVELAGRGYFVKLHDGVGWGEILKNLFQFKLPVLGATNEFNALRILHSLGIPTMTAAAHGRRGRNPARQESFLITDELAGMASLEDVTRDWMMNPPDPALRYRIIRRLAESVGTMHRAGINHRDCYICHYLLHLGSNSIDDLSLFVIDLHRAQKRKHVPRRYLIKDLAGLCFSSFDFGLTKKDALRFIRHYSCRSLSEELRNNFSFWQSVQHTAHKLYRRKFKRSAPDFFAANH